jgi:hypothetical protein
MPNFGCLIKKRKSKESNVKQEKKEVKFKKPSIFSPGKLIPEPKLVQSKENKKLENKKCLKTNGPMKLIKIKKLKNKDSS